MSEDSIELRDVCSLIKRGITPKYGENGLVVVNQRCIRNGVIELMNARIHDIVQRKVNAEKILVKDDILVNSTGVGTAGRVGMWIDSVAATCDTHVTIIRPLADRINPTFLFYFLRNMEDVLHDSAEGSTGQTELKRETIGAINTPCFRMSEQEIIAQVLCSLDDKIDLLKRQNKTLEGMAEALFRQWFIVLEKENVETWKKLSQVTVKITDGTHSTVRDDPDGSFFLLSAKNIKDGQVVTGNSERRISEETLNSLRKRTQTQKGDVLLTTVGTIGESTVLHEAPNFELQRSVAIIRVNKVDITPNFLFQFMQTRLFMHEVDSRVEGSVQKCLFLNAIGDIEVPIPTNKKLEAFDSSIGPFRSKITNNQRSIVRLEAKRDTLLPKLMSGEVRVQMD